MTIASFQAHRFRNFSELRFTPSPKINIIYGDNASGKTSLLEAIYYLGRARSFRTAQPNNLTQHETEDFVCFAEIYSPAGHIQQLGIQRSRDQFRIRHNGENLQRSSDLARLLPLQIINNDIHDLIDGGPKIRRQFLDWGLFHHEPGFGYLMQTFQQTLKQRNAALKQKWTRQQVKHWDKILIETAEVITEQRQSYSHIIFEELHKQLQDSFNLPCFTLKYRKGWDKELDYPSALEQAWDGDSKRGSTSVGPHKADMIFTSNSKPMKEVISRGQQKILATMLLLAQIDYYNAHHNQPLVLLIDDLPSELDRHFCQFFLEKALQANTQLFITATDYRLLPISENDPDSKLFHVERNCVTEEKFKTEPEIQV